jgi:hypothetical protein
MLLSEVRGEVRAHLALEARLPNVAAHYRHGAAVDLNHEAAAGPVSQVKLQPSFIQMAGETESENTASSNSSGLS